MVVIANDVEHLGVSYPCRTSNTTQRYSYAIDKSRHEDIIPKFPVANKRMEDPP